MTPQAQSFRAAVAAGEPIVPGLSMALEELTRRAREKDWADRGAQSSATCEWCSFLSLPAALSHTRHLKHTGFETYGLALGKIALRIFSDLFVLR